MTDGSARVDAYVAGLPDAARAVAATVRARIHAAVPHATEGMSYGIPTFYVDDRYLVYVAAWKQHLSIYPVPRGDEALLAQLKPYLAGRGTLRFPYGTPIPDGLVERVVAALLRERGGSG